MSASPDKYGGQYGDKSINDFQTNYNKFGEEQSATNANNHYLLVQRLFESINQQIFEYKSQVSQLRQEIEHMRNKVNFANEETEKTLNPFVQALFNNLTLAINNQMEENSKLQNQISELKKEKSQLQSLILAAVDKSMALEDSVGSYT